MAVPYTGGVTRMKWETLNLEQKVVLPAEIFEKSMEDFVTPWFSNLEISQAADIFFRIGTGASSDKCSKHPHACLCGYYRFWLELSRRGEKEYEVDERQPSPPKTSGCSASFRSLKSSVKVNYHFLFSGSTIEHECTLHCSSVSTVGKLLYEGKLEGSRDLCKEVRIFVRITLGRPVLVSCSSSVPAVRSFSEGGRIRASDVLRGMLSDNLFPDVKLAVEDQTLPAHRAVLAASSAVFKAMFQHDSKESQEGQVEVADVRADVLDVALKFLYGEDIPTDDPVLCTELLTVAERFQLLALKEVCEDVLSNDTSLDTLELLLVADTHQADRLRTTMLQRITTNPNRKDLVDDAVLKKISKSHPELTAYLIKALL